jgi:hypothetical protein
MTFLGVKARDGILYVWSILLIWLKVDPTKGKKATDVRFCPGVSSLLGGFRA